MSYQALALYPRKDGATFDEEFYLTKHMPDFAAVCRKHGFKSYAVNKCSEDSPYMYIAVMDWENKAGLDKALQDPEAGKVLQEVPQFTNIEPQLVLAEVINRS